MVGLPYDLLANPTGAVRLTFKEAMADGNDPTLFEGKDWGAIDVFNNFLFHQNGLSQVPILDEKTAKWIQPNTLVRFRGMIQDMLGNEIYVGAYKDGSVWRTNKFIDHWEVPIQPSMDMKMWQRNLFYCVPVPGQNSWIESSSEVMIKRIMDRVSQQREKRVRPDDEVVDPMDSEDTISELEGSPSAKKRREDGHPSESSLSRNSVSEDVVCSSASVLPDIPRDSISCIVKIYDTPESDFKLNEVFEFIGIFTLEDSVHQDSYDDFEYQFKDKAQELDQTSLPSPTKVPHLHCFIHRKLAIDEFLPTPSKFEPKSLVVKEIRENLLSHLTDLLGQDSLAAHFVLLHLLSKVQYRSDDYAVGKFSVNLTRFSKENASLFGTRLNLALKNLLPFTDYLPLTIESMNATSFSPKKDFETNRLITGALQLAEGTHLMLDETKLESGTLNSVGVANARSLKKLFELLKVYYDFKYSEIEMSADFQLLVLSEGKSNLCPADLVLPFQPSSAGHSSEVSAEATDARRWYLATLRSLPHSIDTELQNVIENDLVLAKQVDQNLQAPDFHRLLTMARLMCVSYGESSLSYERWQMVKELERQRRERLS